MQSTENNSNMHQLDYQGIRVVLVIFQITKGDIDDFFFFFFSLSELGQSLTHVSYPYSATYHCLREKKRKMAELVYCTRKPRVWVF